MSNQNAYPHTELVLGVDGGSTRTRARLANGQGEILGAGEAGTANPNASGVSAAQNEILTAVERAFEQAGIDRHQVAVACLGVGGMDRPEERTPIRLWAEQHLASCAIVINDGEILLAAGTPENWGVGLVAGTGSIAWGKSLDGKVARAGGWGYAFGDEGSGFDLARQALQAAAQAADGRGPKTRLLADILAHWDLATPMQLIPRVYRGGLRPADLAALAPLVTRAAEQGDPVAHQLVTRAGQALATAVIAVCAALAFRERPIPLALTGGLVLSSENVRSELLSALKSAGYEMSPVMLVKEPVQGAVRLALAALSRGTGEC